jgi:hypothetical protein
VPDIADRAALVKQSQPVSALQAARPGALPLLAVLLGGVLMSLAAQAWLSSRQIFNGDELHFLSLIYEHGRGRLESALQTFHVHLLWPLTAVPGTEIDQLIAGRLTMLALEATTLVLLYLLARAWAESTASLLAVLAFAAMPTTLEHAASFRADPLALALVMASLAMLARAPMRLGIIAATALLAALAALVTMKVVFFAPAYAGIAAWRIRTSRDPRRVAGAIAVIAVIALVSAALIFLLHQSSVQGPQLDAPARHLANVGSAALFSAGILPNSAVLIDAARGAPLQTMLIIAAFVAATVRAVSRSATDRWEGLALLGCLAPLATLLFYRNSFPYFLPFISAPGFVAIAWLANKERWNHAVLAGLGALMLVTGAIGLARLPEATLDGQRAVVTAVHDVFPEPVEYIDRSGLIASFPRQGFLMTSWGMQSYQGRAPVFHERLQARPTSLLIVNGPVLEEALGLRGPMPRNHALHPADRRLLRENYVRHWGPIWVAGKRVRTGPNPARIEVAIPGTYTLEGAAAQIGGQAIAEGGTVTLAAGQHQIRSARPGYVTLRWGRRLHRPAERPPTHPIFSGF